MTSQTNTPDQLDLEGSDPERKIAEMIWWLVEPITAEQAEPSVEDYLPAAKTILSRLRASEAECERLQTDNDIVQGELRSARTLATSQAEAIAALKSTLEYAEDRLHEINVSNYDHDDVCRLNERSVEVILAVRYTLEELSRTPAGEARPDAGEQSQ